MKKWLSFAINWLAVLILLFLFQKGVFLLYFFNKTSSLSIEDIIGVFMHGLWLDISLSCYLITLPFIFFLFQVLFEKKLMSLFFKIYLPIIFFIIGLLFVGDLGIYENWSTKLNVRAIQNILNPKEMMASSGASPVWLYILLIIIHVIYGWYAALYLSKRKFATTIGGIRWLNIPYFILISGFTLLGIRGNIGVAPINESSAYFSKNMFANHAAINTTWYSIQSIVNIKKYRDNNPYLYMDEKKAEAIVGYLFTEKNDSTTHLFKSENPNIIFIQLEGFGADVVEGLGGKTGLTPQLGKLIKEGLLFENIYASGFRTDQGLVAILSGFPAQPNVSIIWNAEKQEKLPTITKNLNSVGYNSMLMYGGDLSFSNFKAYAFTNEFNKIISQEDFPVLSKTTKWGVDDGKMLEKAIEEISSLQTPFFSYLITLTSHEPYDIPEEPHFKEEGVAAKFMSSIYYVDQEIGKFIETAKKKPWYKNTVFIFCADHGHRYPYNREILMPGVHHIPLLIWGDGLNDQLTGKRIRSYGSQTDIASTLLNQLNINSTEFKWSNDLLNFARKNYAYYSFDDGFGWVSPSDTIAFNNYPPQLIFQTNTNRSEHPCIDTAKAYLQLLYDAYLKY